MFLTSGTEIVVLQNLRMEGKVVKVMVMKQGNVTEMLVQVNVLPMWFKHFTLVVQRFDYLLSKYCLNMVKGVKTCFIFELKTGCLGK